MSTADVTLAPRLVVSDAAKAIDLYVQALGATELERYTYGGKIVHAALALGNGQFMLKDGDETDRDATTLGATPVFLTLDYPTVEAVDDVVSRMVKGGSRIVYPFQERPEEGYGGRLTDPFGHVWMIGRRSGM